MAPDLIIFYDFWTAPTVFYTVCFLTTLFFLQIATQFSSIAEGFARVEKSMKHFGYPKALGLKIQLFLYTFFILAAGKLNLFKIFF